MFARRVLDAGLAHPVPPAVAVAEVTVVVPAHDRADQLDRCLAHLDPRRSVVVVDDGSSDPEAVSEVAERHGARLLHHDENRGPAAARNTALATIDTDLVAFLDSDCVATPVWIEDLAGHFADATVVAVAPRIVPVDTTTAATSYAAVVGALDLGDEPGSVAPGRPVSYVPVAALLVRRSALTSLSPDGRPFDESMRYGEDVDLIWRLASSGGTIRYDPLVYISHDEPTSWGAVLGRRFRYGTSAGPLALRHGTAMVPFSSPAVPVLAILCLLARRPVLAAAAAGWFIADTDRVLAPLGMGHREATGLAAAGLGLTALGLGRVTTQLAAPLAVAAIALSRRRSTALGLAAFMLAPAVDDFVRRRPALNPAQFTAARIADDIAYGAGVWRGAARAHTAIPLLPRLRWRRPKSTTVAARSESTGSPPKHEVHPHVK
jgi:mycofactocin system glycosyltransferase